MGPLNPRLRRYPMGLETVPDQSQPLIKDLPKRQLSRRRICIAGITVFGGDLKRFDLNQRTLVASGSTVIGEVNLTRQVS